MLFISIPAGMQFKKLLVNFEEKVVCFSPRSVSEAFSSMEESAVELGSISEVESCADEPAHAHLMETAHELHDFFVLENEKGEVERTISIQNMVKKMLQHWPRNKSYQEWEGIRVYRKSPPCEDGEFLAYQPNQNGKSSMTEEPAVINGAAYHRQRSASPGRYGSLWFKHVVLTKAKEEEILQKREEQRHNRRHDGDSPNPT